MDIDDVPVLRLIPLAAGILKVVLLFSGYLLFPALSLAAVEGYFNRSYSPEARRYFILKAVMWGAVSWLYIMIMQCMITNLIGGPDPMTGRWIFFSWPYSLIVNEPRNQWFYNEAMLMALIICVTSAWAWCIGEENSSKDFIPRRRS